MPIHASMQSAHKCAKSDEKVRMRKCENCQKSRVRFRTLFSRNFLAFFCHFDMSVRTRFFPKMRIFALPKCEKRSQSAKDMNLAPQDRIILEVGTSPMEFVGQPNLALYSTCLYAGIELLPPFWRPAKCQTSLGI